MAKKRINTKFVAILLAAVATAGGGFFVANRFFFKKSPEQYILRSEEALAARNFGSAATFLRAASDGRPTDADLAVKWGQAARFAIATDTDRRGEDLTAFQRALEIDPKHPGALRAMVEYWAEVVELRPSPEPLQRLREFANRLIAVEPDNKQARAFEPIATIRAYGVGIETKPEAIDTAIAVLSNLWIEEPENAELPRFIAQAHLSRASRAIENNDPETALREFDLAVKVADDAVAKADQNAWTHFRAFEVYADSSNRLRLLGPQMREAGKVEELRNRITGLETKALVALEQSRALVKVEDQLRYVQIMVQSAAQAFRRGKVDDAVQIMNELIAARPNDPQIVLQAAQILGQRPETRRQAIELLSVDSSKLSGGPGVQATLVRQTFDDRARVMLVTFRLEEFAAAPAEEKAAIATAIEKSLNEMEQVNPEGPDLLRLKGKFLLLQDQRVPAIQTLNRARTVLARDERARPQYLETVFLLSRAYAATQQTGPAREMALEIVQAAPGVPEYRAMLAEAYLRENNVQAAREQLEFLKENHPDNPTTIRLDFALNGSDESRVAQRESYIVLPESSVGEKLSKSQAALMLDERDEALRLMREAHKQDPKNAVVLQRLVSLEIGHAKDREAAKAAVAESLAADPANERFRFLQLALEKNDPQELEALKEQIVEETADDYTRELRRYQLAVEAGEVDKAIAHLKKASEIKPDDGRAADLLFQVYLQQGQFEAAEQLMPALRKNNQDMAGGRLYEFRLEQFKAVNLSRQRVSDPAEQERIAQRVSTHRQNALTVARQMVDELPEFSMSYLAMAQAQQALGQLESAMSNYTIALQKQARSNEAIRGIIEVAYRLNDPETAIRYIRQGRGLNPQDPSFLELEVNWELNYGDSSKALAFREGMASRNPESPQAALALAATHLRIAELKNARNDQAAAETAGKAAQRVLLAAIAKWPDGPASYQSRMSPGFVTGELEPVNNALVAWAQSEKWRSRPEPRLMLADLAARAGNMAAAEAAAREALALSGDNADIKMALANFYQQTGRFDDAIATIDQLPNVTTDPDLIRKRTELLVRAGRNKDAEDKLVPLLRDNPRDAMYSNLLAMVYLNQGRVDDTLRQLEQTLTLEPANPLALYYRALTRIRHRAGGVDGPAQLRMAISDLSVVRERNPDNLDVRLALADAYRLSNQLRSATDELRQAVRIAPGNKQARLRLVEWLMQDDPPRVFDAQQVLLEALVMPSLQNDDDVHRSLAMVRIANADSRGAVDSASKAMQINPNNPNNIQTYFEVLLQTRAYDKLLKEADTLASRASGDLPWWFYNYRGAALTQTGSRDKAMLDFERGIDIASRANDDQGLSVITRNIATQVGFEQAMAQIGDRNQTDVRWMILSSHLLMLKGDTTGAVEMVERALGRMDSLNQRDQETVLRLAGTIYLTARPSPLSEKALDAYKRLLELVPNDLSALNNVACILLDQVNPPQPKEALKYSERAYRYMSDRNVYEPLLLDTHGWALVQTGQVNQGIAILRDAVGRARFVEGFYHLGEAYLLINQPAQAREELLNAKSLIDDPARSKVIDPAFRAKVQDAMRRAEEALNSAAAR